MGGTTTATAADHGTDRLPRLLPRLQVTLPPDPADCAHDVFRAAGLHGGPAPRRVGHLSLPAKDRRPFRQWSGRDVGRHARLGLRLMTVAGSRRGDRLEEIAAEQKRREGL